MFDGCLNDSIWISRFISFEEVDFLSIVLRVWYEESNYKDDFMVLYEMLDIKILGNICKLSVCNVSIQLGLKVLQTTKHYY